MDAADSRAHSQKSGFLGTPRLVLRDRHLVIGGILLAAALGFAAFRSWSESLRRAEVTHTVQALRSAGTALVLAKAEHGAHPVAKGWVEFAPIAQRLAAASPAAATRALPPDDGWGFPLRYRSDGTTFELRSPGRDGVAFADGRSCGEMTSVDDEMIFSDNGFVTCPPGMVW